ncbi:MAG TPA: cyanophycinase, partial [Actinomycetota bacterium]|nr:cyanophycinase [Actinomycetota bacterium]
MASGEHPPAHLQPVRGTAGPVIIIGGAEDKRRDRVILSRVVELAGGSQASMVVISTASSLGEQA